MTQQSSCSVSSKLYSRLRDGINQRYYFTVITAAVVFILVYCIVTVVHQKGHCIGNMQILDPIINLYIFYQVSTGK